MRSRFRAVKSRFEALRLRFRAVRCPNRRPPRRKTLKTGCRGRGGLRFGHNGAWPHVQLAREPAHASANPRYRTSTLYLEYGRAAQASFSGPTCALAGPRARRGAQAASTPANCTPEPEYPNQATRSPTHRACGGIHNPTTKQPPSMLIFDNQQTEKSPRNQRVCLSFTLAHATFNTNFSVLTSRKVATKQIHFVL